MIYYNSKNIVKINYNFNLPPSLFLNKKNSNDYNIMIKDIIDDFDVNKLMTLTSSLHNKFKIDISLLNEFKTFKDLNDRSINCLRILSDKANKYVFSFRIERLALRSSNDVYLYPVFLNNQIYFLPYLEEKDKMEDLVNCFILKQGIFNLLEIE